MYRGFNLKINRYSQENYELVVSQYDQNKEGAKGVLESFISTSGEIDGTKIQNDWFPLIKADVFISHSHKDLNLAISFAGMLKKHFKLTSFIDSCIWGNSDNLLKKIDDKYCFNPGRLTYNYKSRNASTSHVHMMLSTALSMMIDRTECLFFLNSPNSITANELINKTESAWIYSEITLSNLIRKKKLEEYRLVQKTKYFEKGLGGVNESFKPIYELPLDHLKSIDFEDIKRWEKEWDNEGYPLDKLYEQNPLFSIQ